MCASTADNGTMTWWDYKTGLPFQTMSDIPQPGSLDAEAGIFASAFDMTGSRLITGCADKSIKIYKGVLSCNYESFAIRCILTHPLPGSQKLEKEAGFVVHVFANGILFSRVFGLSRLSSLAKYFPSCSRRSSRRPISLSRKWVCAMRQSDVRDLS